MSTSQTTTSAVAPDDLGNKLLQMARASISTALGQPARGPEAEARLQAPGACFVTLTQHSELRGCIGTLEARRSLLEDVKANAVAAALHDKRFAPLRLAELADTDIEVSVLSPMQAMHFDSEADALAQLRPGVDGVVFMHGAHRSTFLPQVWEQLPTAEEFMAHLKRKAGLPADFWSDGVRLQRYGVQKWHEASGRAS
jgi:AmmeMemoRadiSam system protein A